MLKSLTLATTLAAAGAFGTAQAHELGFAGLLSKGNKEELPEINLSSGKPLGDDMVLKSGTAYELEISSDGSAELQLAGAGFFRAIWINEVVINDLEVRPFGIESLEFDDEGTMEIEFVAIKPGTYELKIPGTTSENQRIKITIK